MSIICKTWALHESVSLRSTQDKIKASSSREGIDQSYQLLRDSLDLYLAMYPDQVQLLLLQARLYFHLGIWPEKVIIHL